MSDEAQSQEGTAPSPARGAAKSHVHYPVLDGLRGMAIALVMLQHFFFHNAGGDFFLDAVVFKIADKAWMGVDLFFVLSGFLITGILWDARGKEGYYEKFYARRVLRIFPAYYLVLIIFFLILPMIGHSGLDAYLADSIGDQAWHWTYLSNFRIALNGEWYNHHIPNVFWSLAVEEQFYFVWPIVVCYMGRKTIWWFCGLLLLIAIAIRWAIAASPDYNWVQSFVLPFSRLDGLVIGAALALLFRTPWKDRVKTRQIMHGAFVTSLVVLAYMTVSQNYEGWRETPIHSLRFTVIGVVCGSALWLCITGSDRYWMARIFKMGWLRYLGKYSYALYLWHGPADTIVRQYYYPGEMFGSRLPGQFLFCALAFALALAFSLLSWHLLEKHCLRLKKRFA